MAKTIYDRFWSKVKLPDNATSEDCWEWVGSKRGGYGLLQMDKKLGQKKKTAQASRISYMLYRGEIPDGKQDTDILVTALYTPRSVIGSITGRQYPRPRGTNNYQLWVDPRDVEKRPEWWSPVMTIDKDATPAVDDVIRLAAEAMGR